MDAAQGAKQDGDEDGVIAFRAVVLLLEQIADGFLEVILDSLISPIERVSDSDEYEEAGVAISLFCVVAALSKNFSPNWYLQGVAFCGIRLFEE